MDVLKLDDDSVQDAIALVTGTLGWKGTLQDASVIVTARALDIEIWTLNYRSFSRFDDLQLWR